MNHRPREQEIFFRFRLRFLSCCNLLCLIYWCQLHKQHQIVLVLLVLEHQLVQLLQLLRFPDTPENLEILGFLGIPVRLYYQEYQLVQLGQPIQLVLLVPENLELQLDL